MIEEKFINLELLTTYLCNSKTVNKRFRSKMFNTSTLFLWCWVKRMFLLTFLRTRLKVFTLIHVN